MTSSLVGDHIETLKPYVPGKPIEELQREYDVDDPIKLASNENPLGPSPRAVKAINQKLHALHYYPDGAAHRMIRAVADYHGVSHDEVVCGNGSDELLTIAVQTFCDYGTDSAVISEYSFAAYGITCQAHNLDIRWVPTAGKLQCDLEAMAEAIDETTKIAFVANPNNPTGTYVAAAELRAFLSQIPDRVVVLVDEAYHQYVTADDYTSAMEMRDVHERLIVTRTLSKVYGLAGVRAGYALTTPQMADRMHRVRDPFNCNSLAQIALPAALGDQEFVERSVEVNDKGRAALEAGLQKLAGRGVEWIPSQTNFVLTKMPVEGRKVYEKMLPKGVIVRPVAGYGLSNCLRISLAEPQKMERCVRALREAIDDLVEEGE